MTFPDPNLEVVIREAIGKPRGLIYPADLERLLSLFAPGRHIADLNGLEHCTNLRSLNLEHNQISDISPLANLTSLRELWLTDNRISDISPLVENEGLSGGDIVYLMANPLSPDSHSIYIHQLMAQGVNVHY